VVDNATSIAPAQSCLRDPVGVARGPRFVLSRFCAARGWLVFANPVEDGRLWRSLLSAVARACNDLGKPVDAEAVY
jgi:hypothetical protein